MNKFTAVVLGALIGLGAGIAGGYSLATDKPDKPAPDAADVTKKGEEDSRTPESGDTLELDRLRNELADSRREAENLKNERDRLAGQRDQLRDRVAKLLDGPTGVAEDPETVSEMPTELTPEQIERKRSEIKARLEQGWEDEDGRSVLDALYEMEALGPSVYDELMKEWIRLDEDHSATNQLGIDKYTWRREWGGSTELLRASIDDPGSPVRYRYTAVSMLPEREAPQTTAEYLSEKLLEERDEHAIMQMAETLGELGDPVAIDPLITVVGRYFERFYAKRTVVTALGMFDDPRTISELKIIAVNENENEAVRAAAESALLHIDPPVSGLLITRVAPGTNGATAGLKTGDILTKLNGELITSSDALHFGGSGEIKFEVFSEGAFKDVTVAPGALGIEYEFVKKTG